MTEPSEATWAVIAAYSDAPFSGRPAIAAALRAAVAYTKVNPGPDIWQCDANELLAIADELEGK